MRRLVAAGLLAVLAGCGLPAISPSGFAPTPGAVRLFQLPEGDTEVLVDGAEIFPAAYRLLQNAKDSIQIDIFLLGGGIGEKVGDILADKMAQGVSVQLVVDPHDGVVPKIQAEIRPVLQAMKAKGIPVRTYPVGRLPGGKRWLNAMESINHSKILVADGRTAMVGGMNFLDGEAINHDYMLQVTGPLAKQLSRMVDHDWRLAGGENDQPTPPSEFIGEHGPDASSLAPMWLSAIRSARQSIDMEMMLVDQPEGISALIEAQARGVAVRVIVDETNLGKHGARIAEKLPLQGAPNYYAIRRLRAAGIPVSWYTPRQHYEFLHAKMAIFDGTSALVGTANFTQKAWSMNRELSVKVRDPQAIERLRSVFAKDWGSQSRPIHELSRWQRVVASIFERVAVRPGGEIEAARQIEALPELL